jgi:hypothetical protein
LKIVLNQCRIFVVLEASNRNDLKCHWRKAIKNCDLPLRIQIRAIDKLLKPYFLGHNDALRGNGEKFAKLRGLIWIGLIGMRQGVK